MPRQQRCLCHIWTIAGTLRVFGRQISIGVLNLPNFSASDKNTEDTLYPKLIPTPKTRLLVGAAIVPINISRRFWVERFL
jgi:hypothetical protein